MRHLAAALVLAAAPALTLADPPPTVIVPVGSKVTVGGSGGRCDDTSIATITADASATITGVKVGATRCSSVVAGTRQVLEVVVQRTNQ